MIDPAAMDDRQATGVRRDRREAHLAHLDLAGDFGLGPTLGMTRDVGYRRRAPEDRGEVSTRSPSRRSRPWAPEQATGGQAGSGRDGQAHAGPAAGDALDFVDDTVQAPLVHAVGDAADAVAEVLGVAAKVAGPLGVAVRQRPQAPGQLVDRSGGAAGAV